MGEMGNGYIYEYQPATKSKRWNLPNQKINGLVLHSIGTPQPKAQGLVNNFNTPSHSASVHGFIEPGKYIETAPTRVSKGVAKRCYHVGGDWNNSRIGIEMCEPSTIKYIGGASWKDLDPTNTKKYIAEVTKTAVLVFADLCIYHEIPVSMISTHKEAFLLGHGSNHGDPDHLWKSINYDIIKFRNDVQTVINNKGDYISTMNKQEFEEILKNKFVEHEKTHPIHPVEPEEKVYKYLNDLPQWAYPSVKKCVDKGFVAGQDYDKQHGVVISMSLSMVRMIVINDKAGLYNKEGVLGV